LILDLHLVKLINATDTMICKHERTSFNAEVTGLWVLDHTCCQTGSTGRLSTGVDSSGQELADIFQKLGLCSSGIANYANIDITSELESFIRLLLDSSEELQQDALLDVQMTVNVGSN